MVNLGKWGASTVLDTVEVNNVSLEFTDRKNVLASLVMKAIVAACVVYWDQN
jgi:hypothetical protein